MIVTPVKIIVIVICASAVSADEYLEEVQKECKAKSDVWTCGRYEAARFISRVVAGEPNSKTKLVAGVVDFVTLDRPETGDRLFPAARQISNDSAFRKFVKFVMRQVDAYLGSRAIAIALPGQTRIVDPDEPNNDIVSESEGRAKKKKVSMILPIIILFKLFKVKVLITLTLIAVLMIKKALLFAFLIAPSYLNMLKICKMPHYPHPPPAHIEEHDFGSTGYGYGHTGGHHHGSYSKDWANSRAYAAYKPT